MEREVVTQEHGAFPLEPRRCLVDNQIDGIEAATSCSRADLVGKITVLRSEYCRTHLETIRHLALDTHFEIGRRNVFSGNEAVGVTKQAKRTCRELTGLITVLHGAVNSKPVVHGVVGSKLPHNLVPVLT